MKNTADRCLLSVVFCPYTEIQQAWKKEVKYTWLATVGW